MSPLVSVVLPIYRSERFIADTLRSVLAQTHRELELLVVDDGSPDDSVRICTSLCASLGDERLRLLRQENRGSCRARNLAIREARGEYVALIDHDDLWLPEKLERHVAHLEANPAVGVSFGPSAFIDEDGERVGLLQVPRLRGIDARHILCRNPIGNGSAPVLRRAVLEDVCFEVERDGRPEPMYFDDECAGWEDVECWLRIALTTPWTFEGLPDCLTLYRLSSGGITGDAEEKQRRYDRALARLALYAPELVRRHGRAGRAYHLRYLASRQVMARRPASALRFAHRALASWPGLLIEDGRRTLAVLGAAHLQRWLPRAWYQRLEDCTIARVRRAHAARAEALERGTVEAR